MHVSLLVITAENQTLSVLEKMKETSSMMEKCTTHKRKLHLTLDMSVV